MRSIRSMLVTGAAVGSAVVGGAAIANAATTSSSSPSSSGSATSAYGRPPANMPAPGTSAHEDAEKPVTGEAAAKAQAAAVKAVGSGTAGPVTTDYTGTGYETTVTKSNGSKVEVHLNSSFQVMQGPGGPGGHGPGGHGPGGWPGRGPAGAGPAGYGSGQGAPSGYASAGA